MNPRDALDEFRKFMAEHKAREARVKKLAGVVASVAVKDDPRQVVSWAGCVWQPKNIS